MDAWWCIVIVFFMTFVIQACSKEQELSCLFSCEERIENPYGICSHISRRNWDYEFASQSLQTVVDLGATWVRSDIDFFDRPKHDDKINVFFDSVFNTVSSFNVNFLGILTNPWKSYAWLDMNRFAAYSQYVVNRYSTQIFYWEILNEVDLISKWRKDAIDGYVNTLKNIYQVIHSANSRNKVLLSGLSSVQNNFLDQILSLKAYDYFDIANFHSYDVPENLPHHFLKIKEMMEKYNWYKPIWITEYGYHTALDSLKNVQKDSLELIQAQRVARAHIIAFAYGIEKVFWYNLRSFEKNDYNMEDHFGLVHKDFSQKPASIAYKVMTTMCPSGSSRPKLEKKGEVYLSSWKKTNGGDVWALWHPSKEKKIFLVIEGNAQLYDFLGNQVLYNDNQITVSPGVVYIVGATSVKFAN